MCIRDRYRCQEHEHRQPSVTRLSGDEEGCREHAVGREEQPELEAGTSGRPRVPDERGGHRRYPERRCGRSPEPDERERSRSNHDRFERRRRPRQPMSRAEDVVRHPSELEGTPRHRSRDHRLSRGQSTEEPRRSRNERTDRDDQRQRADEHVDRGRSQSRLDHRAAPFDERCELLVDRRIGDRALGSCPIPCDALGHRGYSLRSRGRPSTAAPDERAPMSLPGWTPLATLNAHA